MTKGYYTLLNNRAAVTVTGPEARAFLQGLVTQDVEGLDKAPLLYSALLTANGKYAFDFFVSQSGETITLECEAKEAEVLAKKLALFKLRRNISIATAPINVTLAWGETDALKAFSYPVDPRHSALGLRIYNADPAQLNGLEAVDFNYYDRLRLSLGVPDGSRDFAKDEDTVADMGLENLHGVSFTKGCYMGQELTSRMHHRGLSKKGLYPVRISGVPLAPFADILVDGNLIGEMRSANGDLGLAMLRHDQLGLAPKAGLTVIAQV